MAYKNEAVQKQNEAIQKLMMPAFEKLDKLYQVPPEKGKAIFTYTTNLYSRNKHFSFDRLVKKVAEYFHLEKKNIKV